MRVLIDGQTLGTPEIERGIGKVFRMILYHLVNGDVAHDWFLAVRDPKHLEVLEKRLYHWIKPKVLPPLHASGEQIHWCRAYGEQLNSVAAALGLIFCLEPQSANA